MIRKTFDLGKDSASLAHFGYVILPKEKDGLIGHIRMSLSDCHNSLFFDFHTYADAQKKVERLLKALRHVYPAVKSDKDTQKSLRFNNSYVLSVVHDASLNSTNFLFVRDSVWAKTAMPNPTSNASDSVIEEALDGAPTVPQRTALQLHTDNVAVYHDALDKRANCKINVLHFMVRISRLENALEEFAIDLEKEKQRTNKNLPMPKHWEASHL